MNASSAIVLILILTSGVSARTQAQTPASTPSGGVTLFEMIERGLSIDPRTTEAYAQKEMAASNVSVAGAALWPSLTARGTATRFREPMIVAPLHRFDPSTPPTFSHTLVQSGWSATYTLFDGGTRRASIQRAEASDNIASVAVNTAKTEVIDNIANAFLSVVANRQLVEAEARRLQSLESEVDRSRQLLEVGRTARVTVLRAEAALANATASAVVVEQQLNAAVKELARLTGVPWDSVSNMHLVPVSAKSDVRLDADSIVSLAHAFNPLIDAARHSVQLHRATERAARAAKFPTVQLAATLLTYGGTGADFTAEWQGGIVASYPIYSGGARSHRIASAAAARDAAEASIRARELEVAIDVDRLIARILEARARITALRAAVAHAEEVARIEQLALSTGSGVQTDFLRAEAALFGASADLVRATHGEIRALIALSRATGNLTAQNLRDMVEDG